MNIQKFMVVVFGGVALVAVAQASIRMARAEEVEEPSQEEACVHAGMVAHAMAKDLIAGKPVDFGKVTWATPPTPEQKADVEKFIVEVIDTFANIPDSKDKADAVAEKIYEKCMALTKVQYSPVTFGGMLKTASSAAIAHPDEAVERECIARAKGAFEIYNETRKIEKADWYQAYPIPEGFSIEAKENVRNVVAGAYSWAGTAKEFAYSVYDGCKAEHQ